LLVLVRPFAGYAGSPLSSDEGLAGLLSFFHQVMRMAATNRQEFAGILIYGTLIGLVTIAPLSSGYGFDELVG
jgi:hypothetical protein